MENIIENTQMNEDAEFFFRHPEKVLRAKETYEEANQYVISQLRVLAEKLEWKFSGSSMVWRHIRDAENGSQIYYSFVFDKVASTKPEITIYLEAHREAFKSEAIFRSMLEKEGFYKHLDRSRNSFPTWAHLAFKTYQLKEEDIFNFSNYLKLVIEKDFEKAYNLIQSYLREKNTLEGGK